MDKTFPSFSRWLPKKLVLLLLLGLILATLGYFIANFSYRPGWDFRNNLWAPAHLLVNGQSPYNIEILFDTGNAVWLPMAIGTFAPLGLLPLQQASNIWWVVNTIGLIALVWLSSGHAYPPKSLFTIVLVMSFLFIPTTTHFNSGQITILIGLALVIIATYDKKFHPLFLALLFAFSLSKPQLTILALPGYLFAYFKEHGWGRTTQFLLFLVLTIGFLSFPLFFSYPQSINDLAQNFTDNPAWAHPSALFTLLSKFNEPGIFIWAILFLLIVSINFRLWHRLPKQEAMVWSLALTPLATPYIWSWDFVLFIPLLTHFLFQKASNRLYWLVSFAYFSSWGVMASMKLRGLISEHLLWWVPWYLIASVVIDVAAQRRD